MNPLTWRRLAAELEVDPDSFREVVDRVEPAAPPALSRIMAAIGAWTASCFFLGSIASLVGLAFPEEQLFAPAGVILLLAAVALRRAFPSPAQVFAEHVGLVLVATGGLLVSVGFGTSVFKHDETLAAAAIGAVATGMILAYPDAFTRAWLTIGTTVCFWVGISEHSDVELTALLHAGFCLLLIAASVASIHVARLAGFAGPVRVGATISLLGATLLVVADPGRDGSSVFGLTWLAAMVLAVGAAWVARTPALRIAAVVVPLLLALLGVPGILVGALATLLAVATRDRMLLSLAIAYTVGFVAWYYYDAHLSLWEKAGALAGAGVVLLGLRAAVNHTYAEVRS